MIARLLVGILLSFAATGAAHALNQQQLLRAGYEPIWQGHALIETCVHDQDRYWLGSVVFACDQFTYDYPYHYGDVILLAPASHENGGGYLCLDGVGECLAGTIIAD